MTENKSKQLFILLMGSAFLILLAKTSISKQVPSEATPAFDFNFTIIE